MGLRLAPPRAWNIALRWTRSAGSRTIALRIGQGSTGEAAFRHVVVTHQPRRGLKRTSAASGGPRMSGVVECAGVDHVLLAELFVNRVERDPGDEADRRDKDDEGLDALVLERGRGGDQLGGDEQQ